jgi:hypothetical protein
MELRLGSSLMELRFMSSVIEESVVDNSDIFWITSWA